MARLTVARVTIPSGAALSNSIDIRHCRLVAIQMPTAWTAAALTFQGRPYLDADRVGSANDALQDVYDHGGTELNITTAASRYVVITGATFDGIQALGAIKVRSGTTGTPVNQAAARELILVLDPRE